jgi:hypothetical protein
LEAAMDWGARGKNLRHQCADRAVAVETDALVIDA